MAAIGDYKMSQVEQSEADAGRARDDNSYWVQRPEVDRLVAAAVEERDRRIEERGLVEGRQEPPAVTTGLEMNTIPEGDENLD